MELPSWYESVAIAADGGVRFRALYPNGRTYRRREVSVREAIDSPVAALGPIWSSRCRTSAVRFRDVCLEGAERLVSPGKWRAKVLPGTGASDHHAIYKVPALNVVLYFPALLLIRLLFIRSDFLASAIFRPHSSSFFFRPGAELSKGVMKLDIGRDWPVSLMSADNVRMLAWLALRPDARAAWDSVQSHAHVAQRIDLKVPHVKLDGWAWGVETEQGLLVSSVDGLRVTYPVPVSELHVVRKGRFLRVAGAGTEDASTSFGPRSSARRTVRMWTRPSR